MTSHEPTVVEDRIYESYQDQHVHFVTTEYGTSMVEIFQVLYSISLLPLLTSLLLPWFVPPSFNKYTKYSPKSVSFTRILMEFLVIITTSVLIVTVFAGSSATREDEDAHDMQMMDEDIDFRNDEDSVSFYGIASAQCVAVTLTFMCIGMFVVNGSIIKPVWLGISGFWNKIKNKRLDWSKCQYLFEDVDYNGTANQPSSSSTSLKRNQLQKQKQASATPKLPFITNYRGLVTYVTVISILAVDFAIFPRRFCKTKLYGFSLMDIGTGCFVFANGIVSPEARRMKSDLKKSIKSSIPILILGIIRLLTVKGLEYHEVVEEYGIHWNFFFTLATMKILSALVFSFVPTRFSLKASVFIACLYEVILVYYEVQSTYVLNKNIPREIGFIAANREGIFSTIGYTSIYLGSMYIGQIIYNSTTRETIYDWCVYAFESFVQIVILWILTNTSVSYGNSSCRRVANLSYILWIVTMNYTLLWLCLAVQLCQTITQTIGILYGPMLYHELYDKNLDGKLGTDSLSAHLDRFSSPEDDGDADEVLAEENILETIEERLNQIQEKLDQRKESISLTEPNSTQIEDFTHEIEAEFERVSAQYTTELEKTLQKQKKKDQEEKQDVDSIRLPNLARASITLEAICYNGLFVFLLGNLLTGLINMSVYTIYVPTFLAIFILWGYASCIFLISVILYWCQIQVKFW